jgi:hypothetical protein
MIVLGGVTIDKNEHERIAQVIRDNVKPGDLLTHTRCMGDIEEHIFHGFSGVGMLGKATKTTKDMGGADTDDIYPGNVTHINRVFWQSIEFINKR